MKYTDKNRKKLYISVLILLFLSFRLYSIDVGAVFRVGNLAFQPNRSIDTTTYSGDNLLYGVSLYASSPITDTFSFESGFYNDSILRNISYTIFNYREKFISIGVGPFFGFFNAASTILKSGISTGVKLELPGVAFINFRSDSTIGGRLIETGDYIQEKNDIGIGFYVYNAISSVNLSSKKFTQKSSDTLETVDSLIEYSFKTIIFQKNIPYRITIAFAYETLSKLFIEASATTTHTLDSIMLNTEFDINITDYMQFSTNLESSIYTFGQDELLGISNPGPGGYLFRLNTGIKMNVDKFIKPGMFF
ncbi:MAG: hypothetical protein J7K04_10855 [Spirochaetales bacterium]|nr:hypothetical protein [Spirochaetales bacterium]